MKPETRAGIGLYAKTVEKLEFGKIDAHSRFQVRLHGGGGIDEPEVEQDGSHPQVDGA